MVFTVNELPPVSPEGDYGGPELEQGQHADPIGAQAAESGEAAGDPQLRQQSNCVQWMRRRCWTAVGRRVLVVEKGTSQLNGSALRSDHATLFLSGFRSLAETEVLTRQ